MDERAMLRRLDLNLLVAFDVLIAERSVTKAAARLNVGQPAMSASLAKLRTFFNDPLLVRDGRSYHPTPRALVLAEPIGEALRTIESTIRAGRHFDPATSVRQFNVMASDYVLVLLLGPLLIRLRTEAPNVRFQILPVAAADARRLVETQEVHFLIYPEELIDPSPNTHSAKLFSDRLVCAVDLHNTDVGDQFDDELFRTVPLVSFGGNDVTFISERRLQAAGANRNVEIVTQSFMAAPLLLTGTKFMALLPERLGKYFAERVEIRLVEPPVEFAPVRERLFWSARIDADPAHRWFRERLIEAARQLD